MLHDLVGPIVGSEAGRPEPERERLLVELLALNFHDHFELKPLLESVSLKVERAGRDSLEEVARRVADRQINMLMASANTLGTTAETVSLYFQETRTITDPLTEESCYQRAGSMKLQTESERINDQQDPALFVNDFGGQSVCVRSPDGDILLTINVLKRDFQPKQVRLSLRITYNTETGKSRNADFWISPFDFPVTDNMQLDPKHRFAFVLYDMPDKDQPMELKLVWFPEGYITSRERPVNYAEIRRMLGVEKTVSK
jgi:hypothetical protein